MNFENTFGETVKEAERGQNLTLKEVISTKIDTSMA